MSAQVKRSIVFSEEDCLFVKDVRKEMHLEYILVGISGTVPIFVFIERDARPIKNHAGQSTRSDVWQQSVTAPFLGCMAVLPNGINRYPGDRIP